MDYPHPWITLDASGHPDLSHAYATGIGAWDKVAIEYGYSQFAPGADQHAALDAILSKAQANGLYFITDAGFASAGWRASLFASVGQRARSGSGAGAHPHGARRGAGTVR